MKPIKIVTHSGSFHADELFAVAILVMSIKGEVEIIRSRDESIIATADYVVDVGGVYDAKKKKFDHHQSEGAGKRDNGIPYASCGLVWKHFGPQLCESQEIVDMIDEDLIQVIDAEDNGIESFTLVSEDIHPYTIGRLVHLFNCTWKEDPSCADEVFIRVLLPMIQEILKREIRRMTEKKEAEDIVRDAYQLSPDKRIIVLDDAYPANDVLAKYPEPLFVVKYRKADDKWAVATIRDDLYSYKNRKNLPQPWGGKRDEELQKITKVSDALFCHSGLFLAIAKSREGAMALAELALESQE